MVIKWEKPCVICHGKFPQKCLFCGWKHPKQTTQDWLAKQAIRNRAAFLNQMDISLSKVSGDSVSKDIYGKDGTLLKSDNNANEMIMKQLEFHRAWALELFERHTKHGESIKSISEEESLNPALTKQIIENVRRKILRAEMVHKETNDFEKVKKKGTK